MMENLRHGEGYVLRELYIGLCFPDHPFMPDHLQKTARKELVTYGFDQQKLDWELDHQEVLKILCGEVWLMFDPKMTAAFREIRSNLTETLAHAHHEKTRRKTA